MSNNPTPEAFTAAFWWGNRLRNKLRPENPFPKTAGRALDLGDSATATSAIMGISIFERLEALEWKQANLTEDRIRVFEAVLALMIDREMEQMERPHVLIRNEYEPDIHLRQAAQGSDWDAGLTIFERMATTLTLPGRVMAGVAAESEDLALINSYPGDNPEI